MLKEIVLLCFLVALGVNCDPIPKPALSGVTIASPPYIQAEDGGVFKGFLIDLMDKIAEKAGITYSLHVSPDGKYGIIDESGNSSGMIGQVHNKVVDFALADLTVTEPRKNLVDFTEPFLENQLAALIRREDAQNLTSIQDLVQRNEQVAKSGEADGQVTYGVISAGSTYAQLKETTDPSGKSIFESIQTKAEDSKIKSYAEGVERAKAGKFAMIGESSHLEYIIRQNCDLTVLPDNRIVFNRFYAIAVQKGSKYLEPFNQAIRDLKSDGSIDKLKNSYWVNNCKNKST